MSTAGDTATALTIWATVTAAVPEADPAVAVMVVFPVPAAVTCPESSTAATEASLLVHVTATPVITCPFWSRTSAVNRVVSPKEVSVAEAGLTATVVATGGGGSTAPSPQDKTTSVNPTMVMAKGAEAAVPVDHPSPHLRRIGFRRIPA